MRLQAVLNQIEGLEKRFVYYLESQGYIHPQKLQKTRIARRDYSLADLERIRESGTTTSAGSRCNGPMSWSRGGRGRGLRLLPVPPALGGGA